ncbi:hypothetical protein PIB30_008710 [Stylosanthes scabra]|uniref:Uncharacterized protein n=1 Tax=Stylosanthes scabra TaxID=79078 RepID=A0ABU6U735_9FABA|nr:hypothetical protein [Stylosanthes scabra]
MVEVLVEADMREVVSDRLCTLDTDMDYGENAAMAGATAGQWVVLAGETDGGVYDHVLLMPPKYLWWQGSGAPSRLLLSAVRGRTLNGICNRGAFRFGEFFLEAPTVSVSPKKLPGLHVDVAYLFGVAYRFGVSESAA